MHEMLYLKCRTSDLSDGWVLKKLNLDIMYCIVSNHVTTVDYNLSNKNKKKL